VNAGTGEDADPERPADRVIVATAVIAKCEEVEDRGSKIEDTEGTPSLSSILHPPSRILALPLASDGCGTRQAIPQAQGHPQPVWFTPF
jgi:hypothetical protein